MGAQKYTANIQLPQFGPTDKPTWQGDVNRAFANIDAAHATLLAQLNTLQSQIVTLQNAQAGN